MPEGLGHRLPLCVPAGRSRLTSVAHASMHVPASRSRPANIRCLSHAFMQIPSDVRGAMEAASALYDHHREALLQL